ncbi:hypothetical protein GNP94_23770 [Paenibacillus campinasensis]|uniref:Restriction endonuclease n=1 Tax=Paenibacillus campinasensis TaxID=66347 RepID=A0ABW9TCR6_9BACL|nr:hypothetical protein [Paenibacillus campinasensis]MUG68976.1 hypothetical protein [Paenibacillus campinasensis]
MTNIEKIKAFLSIKNFLNLKDQEYLIEKLELTEIDLTKRIKGKEVEIELYLILHMLGVCNHILAFDESTSVLTKSYSPDAIIELKNGYRFFMEIKSTDDPVFKNSMGNLKKRIDFANSFGLPLFFAIKLSGYWYLYDANYLVSKNGRINLVDDFRNSDFYTMFESNIITFPKGFKAIRKYKKMESKDYISKHDNYGFMVSYELFFNEKLIFSFDSNSDKVFYYFILESLNDAMLMQLTEINEIGNEEIIETLQLNSDVLLSTHGMLLNPIFHIKHHYEFMYDPTTYFQDILNNAPTHLTKEIIFSLLLELLQNDVPIKIFTNKEV